MDSTHATLTHTACMRPHTRLNSAAMPAQTYSPCGRVVRPGLCATAQIADCGGQTQSTQSLARQSTHLLLPVNGVLRRAPTRLGSGARLGAAQGSAGGRVGSTCQMSLAYSTMVRSLLNLPLPAVYTMLRRVHSTGSLYTCCAYVHTACHV